MKQRGGRRCGGSARMRSGRGGRGSSLSAAQAPRRRDRGAGGADAPASPPDRPRGPARALSRRQKGRRTTETEGLFELLQQAKRVVATADLATIRALARSIDRLDRLVPAAHGTRA
jgi:hypothetical protein